MNQWIRLPIDLLRTELNKSAILVLAFLIDKDNGNHKIAITVGDIARLLQVSSRTVTSAIAELRRTGYITDTERTGRASVYTIKEILPPKRRSSSRRQVEEDTDFDVEKYKAFINNF